MQQSPHSWKWEAIFSAITFRNGQGGYFWSLLPYFWSSLQPHFWSLLPYNPVSAITCTSGRDAIPMKSHGVTLHSSQWSAQLRNSESPESQATSLETPASLVQQRCPDVHARLARQVLLVTTREKLAQKTSKDQVEWPHLRPCLVTSWCGASKTSCVAVDREVF